MPAVPLWTTAVTSVHAGLSLGAHTWMRGGVPSPFTAIFLLTTLPQHFGMVVVNYEASLSALRTTRWDSLNHLLHIST